MIIFGRIAATKVSSETVLFNFT